MRKHQRDRHQSSFKTTSLVKGLSWTSSGAGRVFDAPVARVCVIFCMLMIHVVPAVRAQQNERAGPASDPFAWDDFGGTPDISRLGIPQLSAAELQTLLDHLASTNLKERVEAATSIKENARGSEQVLRAALWENLGVRNGEFKDLLVKVRASAGEVYAIPGTLIQMDPSDEGVRALTRVVTLLSALQGTDSMAGYKVNIEFSPRHAGVFRKYIGELMVASGFKALPALVYCRGSKHQETHMFCVKWTRDMGNPILGEQVTGIENPRRLAQLIEAYASVNDLDAISVTISLCNHRSPYVRNAARKSLEAFGQNAKWSIYKEYEKTLVDPPDKTQSYEQWRDTLYEYWDEVREQNTRKIFLKGKKAFERGAYDQMDVHFREVLFREPLFGHRDEIAIAYLGFAKKLRAQDKMDDFYRTVRMVRRLAEPGSGPFEEATGLLRLQYAHDATEHGAFMETAFTGKPALEDASNDAKELLARYGQAAKQDKPSVSLGRVLVVSILFFAAMLLVYYRIKIVWLKGRDS